MYSGILQMRFSTFAKNLRRAAASIRQKWRIYNFRKTSSTHDFTLKPEYSDNKLILEEGI
jgi:hypothetical protein